MRMDDDNKTAWCNQVLLDWYNSFDTPQIFKDRMVYYVSRVWWGYKLIDGNEKEVSLDNFTADDKFNLIKAIIDDYEFKLELPKKYYWRKRKEFLAWFEREEHVYLNENTKDGGLTLNSDYKNSLFNTQFTEQEARELLKGDFDMFEKVECD